MTPTNEQIIAEAIRRRKERGQEGLFLADFIIEVVREGWTPPEPETVDPDILAFREWYADGTSHEIRAGILAGGWDISDQAQAYLAGARMARERERERAKPLVEYVTGDALRPAARRWSVARQILAKYEDGGR